MAPSWCFTVYSYFTASTINNRTHCLCFRVFFSELLLVLFFIFVALLILYGFFGLFSVFRFMCILFYSWGLLSIILQLFKYIRWILIWFAWIQLNKKETTELSVSNWICVIDRHIPVDSTIPAHTMRAHIQRPQSASQSLTHQLTQNLSTRRNLSTSSTFKWGNDFISASFNRIHNNNEKWN